MKDAFGRELKSNDVVMMPYRVVSTDPDGRDNTALLECIGKPPHTPPIFVNTHCAHYPRKQRRLDGLPRSDGRGCDDYCARSG